MRDIESRGQGPGPTMAHHTVTAAQHQQYSPQFCLVVRGDSQSDSLSDSLISPQFLYINIRSDGSFYWCVTFPNCCNAAVTSKKNVGKKLKFLISFHLNLSIFCGCSTILADIRNLRRCAKSNQLQKMHVPHYVPQPPL